MTTTATALSSSVVPMLTTVGMVTMTVGTLSDDATTRVGTTATITTEVGLGMQA